MEILTLLKANIRHKKGGFISVLILTFIISLCLTTIISINYNIEKRAKEALEAVDTGDLTAIVRNKEGSDTMLQSILSNPEVDHIEVTKTITQELEINGSKHSSSTFFAAYGPRVSRYQVYEAAGLSFVKKPEALKPGEIYVPLSFQQLYHCKAGDIAYLVVEDTIKSFTIKGFIEEPFVGAQMIGIKLAFMNTVDFDLLYALQSQDEIDINEKSKKIIAYDFVNIFQSKSSSLTMSAFKKSVNEGSGIIDYSLLSISKEQSKSFTLMFTQIFSGIMVAFLVLLFIVVLIVIGHSISVGIEMDYTNLGVLKSIGCTKGLLRSVFVLEYILAEIMGAAIGLVASIPSIYYLNSIFIRMTGLLSGINLALGSCLLIIAVVILISGLFIFLKTRAIIKISPIRAISGGRESIYFHSRLELPVEAGALNFKMALRQLTSNLKQYISSTLIVAILVFFLVAVTEMNSGLDQRGVEESFGYAYCDLEIHYNDIGGVALEESVLKQQVEKDITEVSSIVNDFQVSNKYFMLNGEEFHGAVYSDPELVKSVLKGRTFLYDNEIVVTQITADELGIAMGDTVMVATEDKEAEFVVSGIFQCTSDLGRTFAFSSEGAKKLIPDYSLNYIDYVLEDLEQATFITKMLTDKYGDRIEVIDVNAGESFDDTITASLDILNIIIYIISIVFAFVVISIVCNKIFLKEQMDFGIYKALGFTSTALRLQFALRFFVVALCGGLIGLFANITLNDKMMSALLRNIGITHYISAYSPLSLLLPIFVLTICFFLFAYLISKKIKRVDTKRLICEN